MKTKKKLYYSASILAGGSICLLGKIFKQVYKYGWDSYLSDSDERVG